MKQQKESSKEYETTLDELIKIGSIVSYFE
jgi:hypothetical protein